MQELRKWIPFRRRRESVPAVRSGSQQVSHPLAQLHREIDRMFERFFGEDFFAPLRSERFDTFFGDFAPTSFVPSVDVTDRGKEIEVTAELPGLDENDVEVEVRQDALVLRGEKRMEEVSEDQGWYRAERAYGSFERVVPLPVEVDADRAEAVFDKGVLRIRLPKVHEEAAPKKIEVKKA